MPLTTEESRKVRKIIASLLKVNLEKVVPEANFFRTLGGSFDKLRPLRLKVEAALGVDIQAITDEVNARTAMKPNSVLIPKSLKSIGEYLGIKYSSPKVAFIDLYTVEFIEAITAKACEKRDGLDRATDAGVIAMRFADSRCGAEVRRIVSRVLNISVEHVTPDSDLGSIDPFSMASLISELNARWGISVEDGLESIVRAAKSNKQGNLTMASRRTLAKLLPNVDFTTAKELHESVLNRLGIIEAIVDRETEGRAASGNAARHEPIFRLPGRAWTDKGSEPLHSLQKKLEQAEVRRLIAECCLQAIAPGARWEEVAQRGITALRKWTTSGRRSRDVTELAKELTDEWELEGIPTLKALSAALSKTLPANALVLTAQALATQDNLTQLDAVKRIQKIAAKL